MIIPKSIYKNNSTRKLAKALLGAHISADDGRSKGRIVETEAYLYKDDPACHAARGMTKRNEPMFGRAGTAYIYLIYGMHLCFNVVSGAEGKGEAVLIRAVEPLEGIELMRKRRPVQRIRELSNGPAKLVQALGMTLEQNGSDLVNGPIKLYRGSKHRERVITTTRIGISLGADLPLRFYLEGNEFVSKVATTS